jgi:predicted nucleotidyltransferase
MMDVSNPMADVVPSAHGPVLAVLASTTTPLTGRAIAELTRPRVSQPRVASILNELAEAGLANRTPAGSASLFSLNRDHLAAGPVEALASLRTQLWERISEHANGWAHVPDGVVVYGSAARGDGDSNSDIDLLVIRPPSVDDDDEDWHRDLTEFAAQVMRWTGNPCEVLDRSADELRSMVAVGERLLAEIRRDGRAVVGSVSLVPAPEAA